MQHEAARFTVQDGPADGKSLEAWVMQEQERFGPWLLEYKLEQIDEELFRQKPAEWISEGLEQNTVETVVGTVSYRLDRFHWVSRFKRHRRSWSVAGANRLGHLVALRHNGTLEQWLDQERRRVDRTKSREQAPAKKDKLTLSPLRTAPVQAAARLPGSRLGGPAAGFDPDLRLVPLIDATGCEAIERLHQRLSVVGRLGLLERCGRDSLLDAWREAAAVLSPAAPVG